MNGRRNQRLLVRIARIMSKLEPKALLRNYSSVEQIQDRMSRSERRGIYRERVRSTIVSVRDSAKPKRLKRPQGVENSARVSLSLGDFLSLC